MPGTLETRARARNGKCSAPSRGGFVQEVLKVKTPGDTQPISTWMGEELQRGGYDPSQPSRIGTVRKTLANAMAARGAAWATGSEAAMRYKKYLMPALKFGATAGSAYFGLANASKTEEDARRTKNATKDFDRASLDLNERIPALIAPKMSENTTQSAAQNYAKRFDVRKLSLPTDLEPFKDLRTVAAYMWKTTPEQRVEDSMSATQTYAKKKVDKVLEAPNKAWKATKVVAKTTASELQGKRENTMQTVEDYMQNVSVVTAKQTSIGLTVSTGLGLIPHPLAQAASKGLLALTAMNVASNINKAHKTLKKADDEGVLIPQMQKRLDSLKPKPPTGSNVTPTKK